MCKLENPNGSIKIEYPFKTKLSNFHNVPFITVNLNERIFSLS